MASENWITIDSDPSQSGSRDLNYHVSGLTLGQRSGDIHLSEGGGTCGISQGLLVAPNDSSITITSELRLPGGAGQVVINGTSVSFTNEGLSNQTMASAKTLIRIEAQLVAAVGKPGTWRFEFPAGIEPGSLAIVAGQGSLTGPSGVVFRLQGRPGERVVFTFRGRGRDDGERAP